MCQCSLSHQRSSPRRLWTPYLGREPLPYQSVSMPHWTGQSLWWFQPFFLMRASKWARPVSSSLNTRNWIYVFFNLPQFFYIDWKKFHNFPSPKTYPSLARTRVKRRPIRSDRSPKTSNCRESWSYFFCICWVQESESDFPCVKIWTKSCISHANI